MDSIATVGFDMDYTLAIYDQTGMDRLSIEATARKLVERGYPERILRMHYRTDFPIRGLLIDREYGNVLKMDRYKYVKKAYHGLRELGRDERRDLYHTTRLRPETRRYHWVDTLYGLSEVSVYAAVVDDLERDGPTAVDYDRLFTDVRECIDAAHQDGSILDEVVKEPSRYVVRDPELGPTLHKLRSSGKRTFLLTNSKPAYTDHMMRYLLNHGLAEYPSWQNYFDVVVAASMKPRFFTGDAPFEEVIDNGRLDPLRERAARPGTRAATSFERGHIYCGGNIHDFERWMAVSGDQVLYVGDHIYGDVLRAKKETAWRTAMIVQEMTTEIDALAAQSREIGRVAQLEELHEQLVMELRSVQGELKASQRQVEGDGGAAEADPSVVRQRHAIDQLRGQMRAIDAEIDSLEHEVDRAFHPFWGSLFKAGPEMSSFGDQVESYACLYTDRATNLGAYSPAHFFRSPRDQMPHEL